MRGIRARGAKLPVQAGATAPACPAVKKRPAGPIPQAEHPGQRHGRDRSIPPTDRHTKSRRLTAAGAALLAAILVTLAVAAAVAAPRAAAAPSLFELQKEAKRTRAEMAGLQTDLQRVGDDLIKAQAKLDEVNRRLTRSRIDLRRAENALDLQQQILAKRAATLYKSGDLDWFDLLSSIQSLADIDTIRSLQRAIADQDRRSENEAQRLAREARRLERQVERDHELAVAAAQEVQNQKIELDQKLAERSAILQDVTKRIKKILASGGSAPRWRWPGTGSSTSSPGHRPCWSPCGFP